MFIHATFLLTKIKVKAQLLLANSNITIDKEVLAVAVRLAKKIF